MSALTESIIYKISARVVCHLTYKHLRWVGGLENIPSKGPFVLVANHSSFFDHFLVAVAIKAVRGDKAYFLTKAESFVSPLKRRWHLSVGAIPIQRDKPDREALEAVYATLKNGHPLIVYPEGTRGPGWPLLPFKDGAFRFALKARVPIVPAGIVGTSTLLPKGATRLSNASIGISFGSPLASPQAKDRDAQLAQLREEAETVIVSLIGETSIAISENMPSLKLLDIANREIEEMLEREEQAGEKQLQQISHLVNLARCCNINEVEADVLTLRLQGLKAIYSRFLMRVLRGYGLGRRALSILNRDPDNLMARYILGRWYLSMPKLLGGDVSEAISNLYIVARKKDDDCRFHLSLAKALIDAGRTYEADDVLSEVIAIEQKDARTKRRVERALEMRRLLYPGKAHIKIIPKVEQ